LYGGLMICGFCGRKFEGAPESFIILEDSTILFLCSTCSKKYDSLLNQGLDPDEIFVKMLCQAK